MAAPTDPRRTVARPGAISQVLTGLAQCLKWLILSLVFSVLIEWIGMAFWWEEQGVAHSRQMLVNELQFLGADFHRSWLTAQPMQFASDLSERFYTIAFEWTGVTDFIQWITPVPATEESGMRPPAAPALLAGCRLCPGGYADHAGVRGAIGHSGLGHPGIWTIHAGSAG